LLIPGGQLLGIGLSIVGGVGTLITKVTEGVIMAILESRMKQTLPVLNDMFHQHHTLFQQLVVALLMHAPHVIHHVVEALTHIPMTLAATAVRGFTIAATTGAHGIQAAARVLPIVSIVVAATEIGVSWAVENGTVANMNKTIEEAEEAIETVDGQIEFLQAVLEQMYNK